MSQWDKLFQQKIKEVLHHQHRDYDSASLSPTASGNVARALIAEEYYAQADRIAELEKQLGDADTYIDHLKQQTQYLYKQTGITPQTELNAGGEPVKNATYWKRQYNLMASQNDNLKSGLYHANEQIKYLESTPQTKPLTEEDRPFQKVAPKEVADAIDTALGLKRLSDEEIPYLHILQNAHTVPLGSEIWQSDEELQKYKKIIVATVRAIEAKVR